MDHVSHSESLSVNEISTLQLELDAIHSWAVQNDIKLNGKKCKEMLINFLQDQPDVPCLCIDGLPIRVLSRMSVPSSDLLTIYFTLVRSILEYACSVWNTNLPLYLFDKIEHVQKRAFPIIYPGHGYDDALSIAQCPRLKDRRQALCHRTFRKIQEPNSQHNECL